VSAVPAADPQPESWQECLARTAALTTADIPPEDDWPDPDDDTSCPAGYAHLTFPQIDELLDARPAPVPEVWPAGCLPLDGSGRGAGFADGGALDTLAPGPVLGWCADRAHARLAALSDDELIGVLRGWSRQTLWAQARELAAIAELARRRPAEPHRGDPPPPPPFLDGFPAKLSEFLAAEIGMALTLTRVGAEYQLDLALALAARPATAAALEAGQIDLRKAKVILDAIAPLSDEHAAAVESAVLPAAPGQTTGELRIAAARVVLKLDPDAVRRRREQAEKGARVECWTDPEGTANLVGRSLPPAEVLAADKRLCQVAAWWKKQIRAAWKLADPHGQQPRPEHGTDLLRARAYLALLLGQSLDTPPADLLPPATPVGPDGPDITPPASSDAPAAPDGKDGTAPASPNALADPDGPHSTTSDGPDGQDLPPGLQRRPAPATTPLRGDPVAGLPPLAGSINLTLPLITLLGLRDNPGEAAGYGPLPGDVARALANAAAGHPAANWGLIITDPDGRAVGYGHSPRATPSRGHPADGWTITLTTQRIANGCHSP
jgi:hypothetical protein